jgi:hypothetical protein
MVGKRIDIKTVGRHLVLVRAGLFWWIIRVAGAGCETCREQEQAAEDVNNLFHDALIFLMMLLYF